MTDHKYCEVLTVYSIVCKGTHSRIHTTLYPSLQPALLERCVKGFYKTDQPYQPQWHLKAVGFLYFIWYNYILRIRSVEASPLEFLCFTHTHLWLRKCKGYHHTMRKIMLLYPHYFELGYILIKSLVFLSFFASGYNRWCSNLKSVTGKDVSLIKLYIFAQFNAKIISFSIIYMICMVVTEVKAKHK